MSDNPVLKVSGEDREGLATVLGLAGHQTAAGWVVDKDKGRLVLFWTYHPEMHPFVAPADMGRCADIVMDWIKGATYPQRPDIDGDTERGWLCYREGWGHISPYGWQSFVAIEPYWLMYGK